MVLSVIIICKQLYCCKFKKERGVYKVSFETLYTGFVCALVLVGMLAIIVSIKRLWNVMTWAFSDIVNVLDEKQDISIDEIADYDELPEEEDDIPIESIIFRPSA